jgi:hypothetical protein
MCDIEQDVEHSYRSRIDSLRQDDYVAWAKIVGVCFYDDKAAHAIQAADMVAWLVRQHVEHYVAGTTEENALYTLLIGGSKIDEGPIDPDRFFEFG